jgi:hypothetical protein
MLSALFIGYNMVLWSPTLIVSFIIMMKELTLD